MRKIISVVMISASVLLSGCANVSKGTQSGNIAENRTECLNEFKTLSQIDPPTFTLYQGQFAKLNDAYDVYKKNGGQINKDARDMLGMELDAKLNVVCARVKSATFQNMAKRAKEIDSL